MCRSSGAKYPNWGRKSVCGVLTHAQGLGVGTKLMQLSASLSSALSLRSLEMRGCFPLSPPEEGQDGSVLLPVEPDGFFLASGGLQMCPRGCRASGCELLAATCQHPRAARCVSATWLQLLQHSSRKNNRKRNNNKKKNRGTLTATVYPSYFRFILCSFKHSRHSPGSINGK